MGKGMDQESKMMRKRLDELDRFIRAAEHTPVVVFDTETTGFSPVKDHVVQFSAIKTTLSPDGVLDLDDFTSLDLLIRCPIPMPKDATAVNGITDRLLQEKGHLPMIAARKIAGFFDGVPAVIGHNVPFDLRMMNGFYNQLSDDWQEGMPLKNRFVFPFFCDTLALARQVVQGPKSEHPCALSNLIQRIGCGKEFHFHDSMDDVLATAEVYNWLVRNYA